MSLFTRIRLESNRFTASQERIVQYLREHTREAVDLPINKLAECCQVGDATVIRFYRLLGYPSYAAFRIALAKELSEPDIETRPIYEEVYSTDPTTAVRRKVIASTIQGIADLEGQLDLHALETITGRLQQASIIHAIGFGASGVVAQDFMHKLMRLGLKVISYTDAHMMAIAAAVAKPEELFFAISHSGETTDILRTLQLADSRGCYTCALTSYADSSITDLASAYLLSCTRDTKVRPDSMISRIVQLVVVDILYVMLALRFGGAAAERVGQTRAALSQYRNFSR